MKDILRVLIIFVICTVTVLFSSCEDSSSSAYTLVPKPYTPSAATTEETSSDEPSEEAMEDSSQDSRDGMTEDEYLKYLSNTIIYIGMSEEYIDKTACGKISNTEK